MSLDDVSRLGIEKDIDKALMNPKILLEAIHRNLTSQEIEPKLDVIIGLYSGFLYGKMSANIERNYNRFITDEERADFNELMARRVMEIREAFIKTLER